MSMPAIPDIHPELNINRQDAVNSSVHKTLRDVIKAEMLLQLKLEDTLELTHTGDEE